MHIFSFLDEKQTFLFLVVVPPSAAIIAAVIPPGVSGFIFFVYFISILAYGLDARKYDAAQYFAERGSVNVVNEYEFIKKILYVEFPALVITAANPSSATSTPTTSSVAPNPAIGIPTLTIMLSLSVIGITLRLITLLKKRYQILFC